MTLASLITLGGLACATVQDRYVATPLDERGAPAVRHEAVSSLVISGEELTSYGSEYFGMLQLTFENPTDDWVRIEKLTLDFGDDARNRIVSLPHGPEINAWLGATLQRNVIRDTNEALALGALLAIGTTVASIGAASGQSAVASAGGAVALGTAAGLTVDAVLDQVQVAEDVKPYPDSHLLALPLAIPPGLFSKRWVLVNTRKGGPCIRSIRLDYEVEGKGLERVLLHFRRPGARSEWQRSSCQRSR
jgi:hypothetical protein